MYKKYEFDYKLNIMNHKASNRSMNNIILHGFN